MSSAAPPLDGSLAAPNRPGTREWPGPWAYRDLLLGFVLVLGLTASIGAHIAIKVWELENRQEHFAHLAQEQIQAIRAKVSTTLATLRSIRGLFNASEAVDRGEFRAFVQSLEAEGSVQALEWIPRVPQARRRDYEQAAARDGFPGFQLTERSSQGSMVRAGNREAYFPVYFVEPLAGNERALGFDLGSNATRRAALEQAMKSGQEVATARITLVQETGAQYGFLIFIPVFREGATPDGGNTRGSDVEGFGLGVFRVGDLVSSALSERDGAGSPIEVHVFDQTAPPGQQLLYPKGSPFEASADLGSPIREETVVRFAAREWLIVAAPAKGSVFTQASSVPWLVLVLGLIITGLTAVCFVVVINRTKYANRLVALRTGDLVRSNQERERLLVKLSKTNEELESFAHVASHDLKAPLRGIDNLVSWIVEDPETQLSPESEHNATRLRTRVNRLEALLDGLLEYSSAGRLKTDAEPVDSRQLCEQIVEYLAPPEGLTISVAPNLPRFTTAKPALETVLRNLIGNAIKHNDLMEGRIEVSAHDRRDAYQFTVRDDGPGIDPAHHERIFEIFQTLVPRSKVESSGIGLSIVKRLVEAAGGNVRVESDPARRGTAIHFTWKKTWPDNGA